MEEDTSGGMMEEDVMYGAVQFNRLIVQLWRQFEAERGGGGKTGWRS